MPRRVGTVHAPGTLREHRGECLCSGRRLKSESVVTGWFPAFIASWRPPTSARTSLGRWRPRHGPGACLDRFTRVDKHGGEPIRSGARPASSAHSPDEHSAGRLLWQAWWLRCKRVSMLPPEACRRRAIPLTHCRSQPRRRSQGTDRRVWQVRGGAPQVVDARVAGEERAPVLLPVMGGSEIHADWLFCGKFDPRRLSAQVADVSRLPGAVRVRANSVATACSTRRHAGPCPTQFILSPEESPTWRHRGGARPIFAAS